MRTKINLQLAMLFIAVFVGANTFAQGLYVNAGAGYGFPASPYLMAENMDYYWDGEYGTRNYEIVKGSGSFGKGMQVGAIVGFMFNLHIGAELGTSYLLGGNIENKYEWNNDTSSSIYEYTMSAKMLRFTPALKMTIGNGNIKPYMRTGLVMGVAGKIIHTGKTTNTDIFGTETYEIEKELTNGISLGFAGALGVDFMLSDNISLFAEMSIITQSWAPEKEEWTKYTIDGEDHLDDLTTRIKEIEYVDSYSYDSGPINENLPRQELKIYYPFSSVGINAGVRITLGRSSATKE
jgi:hypothetical protein